MADLVVKSGAAKARHDRSARDGFEFALVRRAPGAGAAADDDGAEHAGDELVFEVMSNIINLSCR